MLYSRELGISVIMSQWHTTVFVWCLLTLKLLMSVVSILFANDHLLFLFPPTCYTVDWRTPTQLVSYHFE